MAIKNSTRFSELEYCISRYFNQHLAPIMTSVQTDLQNKQLKETAEYHSSAAGILNAMADASHMMPGIDTSSTRLQALGKWNSKTTDDYLNMVRQEIASNKSIQKDIAVMASEWRKAVIDEVGRKAYDNASKQIGADLAYAYIGYRFEEQMLGKMVSDRMPKSSIEYVLRKASERSILGMNNILKDCAADQELNRRVEAKYKPSTFENGAARGTAFVMDVITMGGVGSWGSLAKMTGAEVVFAGLEAYSASGNKGKKQLSVEECISQGVFGSNANVFTAFRKDAYIPRTWEHPNLITLNRKLSNKLGILDSKPMFADNNPIYYPEATLSHNGLNLFPFSQKKSDNNREGIPFVIQPGKEDEYRRFKEEQSAKQESKPRQETTQKQNDADEPLNLDSEPTPEEAKQPDQPVGSELYPMDQTPDKAEEANLAGWDGLLKTFGLDGLSATGHNLGYVIAMLPDVIFGALTGKSKNLNIEDNLIPVASVLAGFFVKNPLLKMTLIGLGGANLLNKAGKDTLSPSVQTAQNNRTADYVNNNRQQILYKQYADEPLNPRIANVSIQGHVLLCTIDKVPSSISIPPATEAAYREGALPLNTLANAVLTRYDAMHNELAMNYQQQYEHAQGQALVAGIK